MRADATDRSASDWAEAVRQGDPATVSRIAENLIRPRRDNLVSRPWGGRGLLAYKGLHPSTMACCGAGPWGECFELCADGLDDEAQRHPSVVSLPDGSEVDLPTLLARGSQQILGEAFVACFGPRLPLLPKTLDVCELLSVQAHPDGNTEVYVVLEAAPGASMYLGFRAEVRPAQLRRRLTEGRQLQQRLLDCLIPDVDPVQLQARIAPHLARRDGSLDVLLAELTPLLRAGLTGHGALLELLASLKRLYWQVLDTLNRVEVQPGQVLFNATPTRVAGRTGRPRSAEVHALGNPEGHEILVLEIRRPGTTYRAWDHARFPLRELHIEKALAALSLSVTHPDEYVVQPEPLAGRPGVLRSVRSEAFIVDHLRPRPGHGVTQPADGLVRTLHVVRGSLTIEHSRATEPAHLRRGESALLPVSLPDLTISSHDAEAEAVLVTLPLPPHV